MTLTASPTTTRLAFIDNLRWLMIVLVVSMHAAVTYSHVGSWYYMEEPEPGPAMLAAFATYQLFLQAFFMGLLFLIAGYFVPPAFDRKGLRRFLRDRAVRLGIPAVLFMLFIQPLVVYGLLGKYNHSPARSFPRAYAHYLLSGDVLGGSGPMWFTLALLVFCTVYAVVRVAGNKPSANDPEAPLPRDGDLVLLALAIGLCTFLVRIVQPVGTSILNMQPCYFSQYIFLFVGGIVARRRNWLMRLPYDLGIRWLIIALIGGGLSWLLLAGAVIATHTEPRIAGGFTWQSASLSFWEAFVCIGFCAGLLVLFRQMFNGQSSLARWLSDNSFAVYFFHTPVLIALTLAMAGFAAPKPVKFLGAAILGVALSYLAASLVLRRIPLLKRVL